MASLNSELFIIQEAVQGKLHPNSASDETTDIELDYVNAWNIEQSEDELNARANGKKKITVRANKDLSFTVEAEVLNEEAMLFILGATKDAQGNITIGDTPTETYTYTGVAKMKFADGTVKLMDITIPSCMPVIGDSFGTSSLDLQTYSIKFSCATDEDGNFLKMKEHA